VSGGNFPQRQHLAVLFTEFISSYLLLIADWTERTAKVVATWDSTGERATEDERKLLANLLARSERQAPTPSRRGRTRHPSELARRRSKPANSLTQDRATLLASVDEAPIDHAGRRSGHVVRLSDLLRQSEVDKGRVAAGTVHHVALANSLGST
jgi:hypothetical protein